MSASDLLERLERAGRARSALARALREIRDSDPPVAVFDSAI
jgi:hypothetical protein